MGAWSMRRGLAIFTLVLYCFDTGSDTFVGVDLIFFKCHVRYGLTVLALVLLPGFLYGWMKFSRERSTKQFLRALLFPLWYHPYSIKKLVLAIKNSTKLGDESSKQENEAKM